MASSRDKKGGKQDQREDEREGKTRATPDEAAQENRRSEDSSSEGGAESAEWGEEEGERGGGRGGGGGEGADTGKHLRPWDPPDYNRQRLLADRLSNPVNRSRPNTSHSRARADHSYSNDGGSFDPESSSYPSIQRSPYNRANRPRTVTGSRMSNGSASPRRQTTASYYSSMSASSTRRQPPLFPNRNNARRVTDEELDLIVNRVTRPTVASRGGVDLQDKDFTYIPLRRLKTLPVVPGLERRYLGLQPVNSSKMDEIVYRLTRLTSAYHSKFAPNPNVWVDKEPGAHLVRQRRNAQSAQ